jgi:hypothetical protein
MLLQCSPASALSIKRAGSDVSGSNPSFFSDAATKAFCAAVNAVFVVLGAGAKKTFIPSSSPPATTAIGLPLFVDNAMVKETYRKIAR